MKTQIVASLPPAALLATMLIATQLLIAGALTWLLSRRPRPWRRHKRRLIAPLRRVAPWAAPVVLSVAPFAPHHWIPSSGVPGLIVGIFAALGIPAAAGGYLLLAAGRAEARGKLRVSARMASLGGRSMALGAAGQGVCLFAALLTLPTPLLRRILEQAGPAMGILICAAVAIGVAGFLGLLAGLTAKPRPSGSAAAGLYVAALTALLVGIAVAGSGVGPGAA